MCRNYVMRNSVLLVRLQGAASMQPDVVRVCRSKLIVLRQTPRSTMTLCFGLPSIARHNTRSAARISRLRMPLLRQTARITVMTQSKKEMSKNKRRMTMKVGVLFSLRRTNSASSRSVATPRTIGLRTSDHIPRSSRSHTGRSGLPSGLYLPTLTQLGVLPPVRREVLER